MLTRDQQREILALGLLALGLLLLLALFPVGLLGERGGAWFPSGNMVGRVGGAVRDLILVNLGWVGAVVPGLVALGGLRAGRWLSVERSVRLALVGVGLLALLPPTLFALGMRAGVPGRVGLWIGEPLVGALGWLGAALLTGLLMAVLFVGTLGWNPVRALARGTARAASAAARGASVAGRAAARGVGGLVEDLRIGSWPEPEPVSEGGEPRGGDGITPEAEVAGPSDPEPPRGRSGHSRERRPDLPDPLDPRERDGARLPPLDLLTPAGVRDRPGMERELERLGEVLVEKLRTFNVECQIGGRTTGPVVTQFEVVPAPGVKVNRIANLDADLALAMKAQSIRIVAPIPGKGAVGVEIPNPKPEAVHLREILEARAFLGARFELPLGLGKDLTGNPYVADLSRMPHMLIAGATGSGKSVCLNTIITSLVYRHTPRTLRFLMIDPKMVELSTYSDLPHLRHPVVTDPRDAAGVLKWAVLEMERRYNLLSANGVRSVGEFNRRVRKGLPMRRAEPEGPEGDDDRWVYDEGLLPYVVVVVDELADLMMTVQAEIERPLTLLAQKARAIGIHLLVATQRPSVNVITGLIKANFPCRIAFRVASKTDSRTILDQNGADALLGNGDMLFLPPGHSEPVRIQGAFIATEDTDRLMAWYRDAADPEGAAAAEPGREEDILAVVRTRELEEAMEGAREEGSGDRDDLFRQAAEVCIQHDQGSTSLLQRRLRIGYGRAARIVDQLHESGVLGPPDGSKPREVLMGLAELDALWPPDRP